MPHTPAEKKRVLTRVRRIRGQLDALEQVAAIRGAINGLMAGVLESHLREEFVECAGDRDAASGSIENVVSLVRSYLR